MRNKKTAGPITAAEMTLALFEIFEDSSNSGPFTTSTAKADSNSQSSSSTPIGIPVIVSIVVIIICLGVLGVVFFLRVRQRCVNEKSTKSSEGSQEGSVTESQEVDTTSSEPTRLEKRDPTILIVPLSWPPNHNPASQALRKCRSFDEKYHQNVGSSVKIYQTGDKGGSSEATQGKHRRFSSVDDIRYDLLSSWTTNSNIRGRDPSPPKLQIRTRIPRLKLVLYLGLGHHYVGLMSKL
ncbi:hypothetical protein HDU76_000364 [Blyttiomyces sp. JEL0837]|nr:hypothetical protein HDU76_000364 [Blyttiomyces sp. JEL0837]